MTTSTAALVAALTRLDERVLDAVTRCVPPKTTERVVQEVYPVSARSVGATADQAREVAEVLRGLERAELVHFDGVWNLRAPARPARRTPRGGRTR